MRMEIDKENIPVDSHPQVHGVKRARDPESPPAADSKRVKRILQRRVSTVYLPDLSDRCLFTLQAFFTRTPYSTCNVSKL